MGSIENPHILIKIVVDPIKGIKRQDRELAERIDQVLPGQGQHTLNALAALNRIRRNPFLK